MFNRERNLKLTQGSQKEHIPYKLYYLKFRIHNYNFETVPFVLDDNKKYKLKMGN